MKKKPIGDIRQEIGFCYKARTWLPQLSAHRDPSRGIVLENGAPLPGPSNALHNDIRELGSGRYCFWYDTIYFSTPDNSDPRVNGRSYEIAFALPRRYMFLLVLPKRLRLFAYIGAEKIWWIMRRVKPAPRFWRSLYWICFRLVLIRAVFKQVYAKGNR